MSPALWIAQVALCLGQADTSDPNGDGPALVELRPTYVVGRPLLYRITEKQTIADQADGAKPIETTSVVLLRLVPSHATRSAATLVARVERVQWTVQGPGKPVSFDSSTTRARNEPKEFSTFRELVNRQFQVAIDAHGRTTDVVVLNSADGDTVGQAGVPIVRRWLAMLSAWLPEAPVPIREVWQREETLPVGLLNMVRKSRLQVLRVDPNRTYIEGQIELSGRGGEGFMEGKDKLVASIVATSPGRSAIVVERSSGIVQRMESRAAFEMRVIRIPADEDQTPIVSAQKLSASALVERLDENPRRGRGSVDIRTN